MKKAITLFLIVGSSPVVHSQTPEQELHRDVNRTVKVIPANQHENTFGDNRQDPSGIVRPHDPIPAQVSSIDSDGKYLESIAQGDAHFEKQQYQQAILAYKTALEWKEDQYPKDQILRSEAEKVRFERERELSYQEESKTEHFQQVHSVHFTGLVIRNGTYMTHNFKLFQDDLYSDMLKPGKYDHIDTLLEHTFNSSLDGIAIPAGTRVIYYSEPGLKGKVLLDMTGPAIINNCKWRDDEVLKVANTESYTYGGMDYGYPPNVRHWSPTDMHTWPSGSVEIIAVR